ncbi:MAG: RNA polymerase sigma factor [Ktedonobacterales bacterium]
MEREQPVGTETQAADSDRHLMARTRLSDMGAFEQLFRRYYEPVRRLLYRTVEDDDLADDLVQETFLALYTHPPQLQGDDEQVRAWLYRVALNRSYNALRSRRRSQAHLPEMYVADTEIDPEVEALRTEERKRVREALKLLPERQAKLLLLRQEGGLKYAEIAAILEVAPGSVGTLLVRAERAFELAWNQLGAQHTSPEKNGGSDQ